VDHALATLSFREAFCGHLYITTSGNFSNPALLCCVKRLSARRRRTEGAELDEKIEATIADPANDPEVALQEKDRGELVRRALMRLSIEHREVIDLVYYHDKSVDEVAHILDVPRATVKTRMFYARKKLGELVKGAEKVPY
jgi:RNA polymerase sigma-70 factor, ECF subfamily